MHELVTPRLTHIESTFIRPSIHQSLLFQQLLAISITTRRYYFTW